MKYSMIKENDIANGDGVCVSVWTQGCPHHCKGCFNSKTWSYSSGEVWTEGNNRLVLDLLNKNGVDRNLAILGGEPLCQENIDEVLELCSYIKKHRPGTVIYVWTGYVYEDLLEMYDISLFEFDVLIDGRFEIDKKDLRLKMRGSSNQRVIDVIKSKESKKIEIIDV